MSMEPKTTQILLHLMKHDSFGKKWNFDKFLICLRRGPMHSKKHIYTKGTQIHFLKRFVLQRCS